MYQACVTGANVTSLFVPPAVTGAVTLILFIPHSSIYFTHTSVIQPAFQIVHISL